MKTSCTKITLTEGATKKKSIIDLAADLSHCFLNGSFGVEIEIKITPFQQHCLSASEGSQLQTINDSHFSHLFNFLWSVEMRKMEIVLALSLSLSHRQPTISLRRVTFVVLGVASKDNNVAGIHWIVSHWAVCQCECGSHLLIRPLPVVADLRCVLKLLTRQSKCFVIQLLFHLITTSPVTVVPSHGKYYAKLYYLDQTSSSSTPSPSTSWNSSRQLSLLIVRNQRTYGERMRMEYGRYWSYWSPLLLWNAFTFPVKAQHYSPEVNGIPSFSIFRNPYSPEVEHFPR